MPTSIDFAATRRKPPATLPAPEAGKPLPGHLIGLAGGQWALWRWVCLRGAGFPLPLVRHMAAPEAAAAADELLLVENEVGKCRAALMDAIRRELDCAADDRKRKLALMLTHLNKGRLPEACEGPIEIFRMEFSASRSKLEETRERFRQVFQNGVLEVSERIEKIAADSRFRQAVLLQNRKALHLGIDALLRRGPQERKRGKKERQQEELVASYIQRYCVKNDSIGFFGPIGWVRYVSEGGRLSVRPGSSLVKNSNIYFENWCMEALAEKIGEDEAYRPWMVPRMLPLYCLDGNHLYLPDSEQPLTPPQAAVLKKCNGERTARQIALELTKIPGSGLREEAEVYHVLMDFVNRGILRWKFDLPYLLHPEKRLRSLLERVEDEPLRARALRMLDDLEQARAQVHAAFGDAEKTDAALGRLDDIFVSLTGRESSRAGGAMYAARTLIYQDCQRDIEMEVGPEIVENLGAPLSLVLASARWFTWRAAGIYRQAFLQAYAELARKHRSGTVDFLALWLQVQPFIMDPDTRYFNRIIPEYQRKWEEILKVPEGVSHVQYSSADLKPLVDRSFNATRAGWQLARYHSPDVMIAADSVEAIQRGEYLLVLGELHMAVNTVRGSFAMSQHPHPEQMFANLKADLPEQRIVPVPPKGWPGHTMRTSFTLISPDDIYLESSDDSISSGPRSMTLPISSFVVEHTPAGLVMRTRDGQRKFDLLEALGELLSAESVDCMKITRPGRHQPRITIDRMVLCRESWSFPAPELAFALLEDERDRFLEARRWRAAHNLPRFAFLRVPVEVKPCYIDFESPVYVEILSKMVRRMLASDHARARQPIAVSEMLPAPDHIWLPDAEGNRYTSEFRTVVFDLSR